MVFIKFAVFFIHYQLSRLFFVAILTQARNIKMNSIFALCSVQTMCIEDIVSSSKKKSLNKRSSRIVLDGKDFQEREYPHRVQRKRVTRI